VHIAFDLPDGSRLPVVDGVTLSVDEAEFVVLVGPSGSGKSTILRAIAGLIAPVQGRITVDGAAVAGPPPQVGFMFQKDTLLPWLTVRGNIQVGLELGGVPRAGWAARLDEFLALLRLSGFGDRYPAQLSGGMRQRVSLGRMLAYQPKLMLMDEPFGALDPATRDALGRDYRALHERLGLTTMMVTHDVTEALLLADRVIVMDAGRFVADGTPGELLSDSAAPAIRALMETPLRQAERIGALSQGAAHG
jgi:NitT/TauT family transport system ATP-binding protein